MKLYKRDLINLKSSSTAQKTLKERKRQTSKWEKNVCNHILKQGIPLQNMQTSYATQYGKKQSTQ